MAVTEMWSSFSCVCHFVDRPLIVLLSHIISSLGNSIVRDFACQLAYCVDVYIHGLMRVCDRQV